MIKDSGDRTEFETGAKRDMRAGKGRMDLLPWYGIMEVSKHCEEGALKYGEHNVDKGIPLHSLLDSASRHLAKYMVGMDDEDHLRAACWNLLWALNQRETHPELDDRFAVKVGEVKKKNYQVLCPNCEATIIKENGQICDGVAWRVGVPNEKVELKWRYDCPRIDIDEDITTLYADGKAYAQVIRRSDGSREDLYFEDYELQKDILIKPNAKLCDAVELCINGDISYADAREWCMENDISLRQFDRWLYGALRKSDNPVWVEPKEPWPYRVVAGINRVLEILLNSILEDFI